MLQQSTLTFLKSLASHNDRDWFEKHRNNYMDAKQDFEAFVASLIEKTGSFDHDIKELEVKNCVFRQYRDVRFSKDKRPYKINMGCYLNRGGKKSIYAGYYFHLEPGKSFTGGGLWAPMAPELKKVRQEVDYNFDEFNKVISSKAFKSTYGDLMTGDLKLSSRPKGYDADNPAIEYLKLKSFVAEKPIPDKELMEKDLLKNTVNAFKTLKPMLDFINTALD
jgi:uncharacterized protein (TIGR02453 family)